MSKQKKGPAFLLKTFDMLEKQQFKQIIDWIPEGTGFVVKNSNQLAEKVLPKYFKHSNMHSFIRQLNMYGFNKKRGSKVQNYYFHPQFHKGQRQMISEMQRKAEKKGSQKEGTKEEVNQEVSIELEEQNNGIKDQDYKSSEIQNKQNRRREIQKEQDQMRKNILDLITSNKVLLAQQIYHLTNIEFNNLMRYRLRREQNDEENVSCYQVNIDDSVLQRFMKVKYDYLRIQSMVSDKINECMEKFQIQANTNKQTSLKEFKQTEVEIPKKHDQIQIQQEEHPTQKEGHQVSELNKVKIQSIKEQNQHQFHDDYSSG